ncbi:hypothetical protein FHS43_005622 [Streptosporangium becharense]|uniref:Uncharacterized protein n=1 Tax=Streptosporangium becharense TaxID=1816182 RepID=A0A7W9IP18_9ACTN|nr:hypothetical protein [Streptosporangium becharense]MBB2914310.1 hypothetical protein [Streptosporangium becharense]MBB5823658.1 hypothetical protein [Streptosporangium becharense]
MATAVRDGDGTLLVPVQVATPEGWYADGAVRVRPGDPGYDELAATAVALADPAADPVEDERLIAGWEARRAAAGRRSA